MENYRDNRSSTAKDTDSDAVSILLEEEKAGLLEISEMHNAPSPAGASLRHRLFPILTAILAIANVMLGALLIVQSSNRSSHNTSRPSATHRPPPLPSSHGNPTPIPFGGLPHVDSHLDWLPPEQWRTEMFRFHHIYGEEPVGAVKEAWLSMIPKGKGFVVVNNDTQLPDLPGLRYPEKEQRACVAVFHQLHCLFIANSAYWKARAGNIDDIPPEHINHCWDYLRQSIMCAGDTTLEWISSQGEIVNGSTGWGFQHTCKNFDAIYEWAETHRFSNKVKID